jgi:hypothetical protein
VSAAGRYILASENRGKLRSVSRHGVSKPSRSHTIEHALLVLLVSILDKGISFPVAYKHETSVLLLTQAISGLAPSVPSVQSISYAGTDHQPRLHIRLCLRQGLPQFLCNYHHRTKTTALRRCTTIASCKYCFFGKLCCYPIGLCGEMVRPLCNIPAAVHYNQVEMHGHFCIHIICFSFWFCRLVVAVFWSPHLSTSLTKSLPDGDGC